MLHIKLTSKEIGYLYDPGRSTIDGRRSMPERQRRDHVHERSKGSPRTQHSIQPRKVGHLQVGYLTKLAAMCVFRSDCVPNNFEILRNCVT